MNIANRKRTLAPLLLILLVALGATGVAYAAWTDALTVGGTVNTGTMQGTWTDVNCYERVTELTDIGWVSGHIDSDARFVTVTLNNAYPGYKAGCELHYNNSGTLPFKVADVIFTGLDNLSTCTVVLSRSTGSLSGSCGAITVNWTDGLGSTLDPNDPFGEAGSLTLNVNDSAQPTTTYRYRVDIKLQQWTPQ